MRDVTSCPSSPGIVNSSPTPIFSMYCAVFCSQNTGTRPFLSGFFSSNHGFAFLLWRLRERCGKLEPAACDEVVRNAEYARARRF